MPQWRWTQIDLNASVIKHLCPWDKGKGGERATLILMKKCSSLPPSPVLYKNIQLHRLREVQSHSRISEALLVKREKK